MIKAVFNSSSQQTVTIIGVLRRLRSELLNLKHNLVEFKVQCLKAFCYHGNKSTILLFDSIFRTTPEVSSELYFVEIC